MPATRTILPDTDTLKLLHLCASGHSITLVAQTTSAKVLCPACGTLSRRAHSRYERTLADLPWQGIPLILLTHYQTPAKLRRAGQKRVAAYLRSRGVKGSTNVAHKALSAAGSQSVTLLAQEEVASRIVAELAEEILAFKERIESIDEEISQRFFARPEAG